VQPVRLRGLFIGGSSQLSFSLSAAMQSDPVEDAGGTSFSFGSELVPDNASVLSPLAADIGSFDASAAGTAGVPAAMATYSAPTGSKLGADALTTTAWAAPVQDFMRKGTEDDVRRHWRLDRREARSAYKKLHQDTVRQQRKNRQVGAAAGGQGRLH